MKRFLTIILFLLSYTASSIEFKYKWNDGYRIESVVYQNVKLNREIILSSTILNKYAVEILDRFGHSATLEVTQSVFQESKAMTEYYTFAESLKGKVSQNEYGLLTPITDNTFPTVQNVPNFPKRDVKVGESWTAMAKEHFNLKNGFNIDDTVTTKFMVFYTYRGNRTLNGKEYAEIELTYNFFEKITPYLSWGDFYPVKINGGSKQIMLWDIRNGRPFSLEDDYFLEFATSTGDRYIFTGKTDSKCWPKNNLDGDNIMTLLNDLKSVPQTTVESFDDHLTITFNSLLFEPESWFLKEGVKSYLDKIGSTLSEIEDVNIRISGHTAIFGEEDQEYLNDLSLKRAHSVADYLLNNNYLDKYSIEVLGHGGDKPVDTNSTKEGRSRNRRVEIDILKN